MHAFLTQSQEHLPMPVPAFGESIRRRRLEVGLNCARAAAMTGIDRAVWNALEAGWVPSKNERLLRSLAATLQINYDVLVNAIAPLEEHFAGTAA
jgi:ribosome-binding protein aMBF1 (putative translation factor)